ncbi:hypothetical protein DR864_09095 [Runella rosea]|uniref:HD-CE domain-containing protein n=1 Tax=Runella rosea TaxID=2259595 RepID=A0A344TGV4_9BACT|nr:ATP-binding protein [Runella rosea]AXE17875.1 hypothetical protein DR864_09095 [Runella rosea]
MSTIITQTPENYQDTKLYALLLKISSPSDGLVDKVTNFINTVRPLQELIIAGPFKDYTLHNPNHSKKLLHLAGFIIPEETLQKLSSLEISVLIMSFYLHDLGMVVTQIERERIIKSTDFIEFIQTHTEYDEKMERIRKLILDDNGKTSSDTLTYETTLYQLTEAALADFLRPLHATKLRYEELIDTVKKTFGRNDLFEVCGVSFENELIEICVSHNLGANALIETKGIYNERFQRNQLINNLPLNSQFCAAVLRIVDILDFDKERTPKSLFNSLGIQNKLLPGFEISLREWNKHLSIHSIAIYDNEIVISGDSRHPTIEHTIKEFCKIIESEIRETQTIINSNSQEVQLKYKLNLPFLIRANIRSIDYIYKDFSIKLNESAIVNLLMGENLYIDSPVALRELIQNSIDACIIRAKVEKVGYSPLIRISIHKDSDSRSWLKIIDNGIGMDEYVLSNYFFKIGNSYYSSSDFKRFSLKNQVDDFVSISRFGIGLLSVFMIGELIKVTTKNAFSLRNDFKERTLLIDGTDSLAVVTEKEFGIQGTTIEVLLRKGHDDESYSTKLYGYIKENVIRPQIPIELYDSSGKTTIVSDNYISVNNKMNEKLKKFNIELVQIDLSRFSNLLKGKCIFYFFINPDETLCYYDKSGKLSWGLYPLKDTYLFENFAGGSRITVNGIMMRLKKIGSLFNMKNRQTAVVLDIEVLGVKDIEYDVSRDRVFGKGLSIIRKEIFTSIKNGLQALGVFDRLDEETVKHLEISSIRKVSSEPLDFELMEKVKKLLPSDRKWETGIHKKIADELQIGNYKASQIINAMIKLGKVIKPE